MDVSAYYALGFCSAVKLNILCPVELAAGWLARRVACGPRITSHLKQRVATPRSSQDAQFQRGQGGPQRVKPRS